MDEAGSRVLVVDDDRFTRTLVCSLVGALGYDVCGSAATVSEAMSLANTTHPSLAIIDLDLGEGPTGLDLGHGLRKLNSTIALVMLTSYADPLWMGQRREAPTGMRYVVKGDVSDPAVLGDAVAAALVDPLAHVPSPSGETPLSEGQWEILRLVASGYTNAEIAKRRSLTVDSVNKAITRLVRQLDIQVGDDGNPRVLLSQAYRRMTGTVSDRRG